MPVLPKDQPVVVILGGHPFPFGNASANRMLTMGMTWKAAGWRSVVINDDPRLSMNARDGIQMASDIEYVNLGAPHQGRLERMRRRRTYATRINAAIGELGISSSVTHFVIPSFFCVPSVLHMIKSSYARADTVVDVVERHDVAQFTRGLLDPYLIRHYLTSGYAARRGGHITVISKALADGPFRHRDPLVIPPCVNLGDFRGVSRKAREHSIVRIAYLGSPGRKDDLSALLRAIALLEAPSRERLVVTLAGFEPSAISKLMGVTRRDLVAALPNLELLGCLDRGDVREVLSRTHYSYLLRDPEAGFAKYGFPSKIPEALAAGCPPITNLTSDLRDFLTNGDNALVAADATPEAVARSLARAVSIVGSGGYEEMSKAARKTAERRFDPAVWSPALIEWLER